MPRPGIPEETAVAAAKNAFTVEVKVQRVRYEHDHLEYALNHLNQTDPTMQIFDAHSHREYTKDYRGGEV